MIPELWRKANAVTLKTTLDHLNKYKHLLKWKRNESILEVGCGDGHAAKEVLFPNIPKDYKELCVSDKHPNFVEYIKKNIIIPKSKIFKLDVVEDEIKDEFKNRFDHIFGFHLLHMLKEPRKALMNLHEMLKPDGQVFLTIYEHTPLDDALEKLSHHAKWGKYDHRMSPHRNHENPLIPYTEDFIEAGFKNPIFNVEKNILEFEDEQNWKDLFVSVNPSLQNIPENEKEEYIECYLNYFTTLGTVKVHTVNGKQIWRVERNMFVVVAKK